MNKFVTNSISQEYSAAAVKSATYWCIFSKLFAAESVLVRNVSSAVPVEVITAAALTGSMQYWRPVVALSHYTSPA